jgi:hypothetical protein
MKNPTKHRGTETSKALAYDLRRRKLGPVEPVPTQPLSDESKIAIIMKDFSMAPNTCQSDGSSRSMTNWVTPPAGINDYVYFTRVLSTWTTGWIDTGANLVEYYPSANCTGTPLPMQKYKIGSEYGDTSIKYGTMTSGRAFSYSSQVLPPISGSYVLQSDVQSYWSDFFDVNSKMVVMRGPLTIQEMKDIYDNA